MRRDLLRILDANFNRSREGLRVCEEIARFVLEDRRLARALKKARHAVTASLKRLPVGRSDLLACRDTGGDVGRVSTRSEKRRSGFLGLFLANIQRVKESLRVLEEGSKLFGRENSEGFKKIRFDVYDIEKRSLPKLETLCDHGPGRRGEDDAVGGRAPRRGKRGKRRSA